LKNKRIDILFIGNSHTYLHHMPQMVDILAQTKRPVFRIHSDQAVGEGVDLQWHAKDDKTRSLIAARAWDFVVLQERSGGPVENPSVMFTAARRLDCLIRDQGSRTVFFMTWANRNRPETQAAIAGAYVKISRELRALLAPVGLAWQQARTDLPDLDLYHPDGRHAGRIGTYLTACTFVHLFTGVVPGALSRQVLMDGRAKVDLPHRTAHRLQQIACNQLAAFKSPLLSPDTTG